MSETSETFQMVEWLENTTMVDSWELAGSFEGFILPTEGVNGLDPEHMPQGWKIGTVFTDEIFIKRQE